MAVARQEEVNMLENSDPDKAASGTADSALPAGADISLGISLVPRTSLLPFPVLSARWRRF